jgi:hypothetical protein
MKKDFPLPQLPHGVRQKTALFRRLCEFLSLLNYEKVLKKGPTV